ncbi:MAG: Phosphoesterase PA-phosphatase related protein [Candidatus Saccharibacteria bacterium]|nr:Phosphoesterase PA-phosphatase related protein [Candidatus Saccharibacteria bacterium]
MQSLLHRFDTIATDIVLSLPMSLQPAFLFITNLGHPAVTMAIGAGIASIGLIQSNVRLFMSGSMVWIALGVGSLLKLIFGRARPVTDYAASIRLDTLSFPSGHTTGSTIAYGLLAYLAWHLLPQPWNFVAFGGLIALIILIGISRVYLGAHFPTDVIAGWILGGAALLVVIFFIHPLVGK